jgi:hypothetical protein
MDRFEWERFTGQERNRNPNRTKTTQNGTAHAEQDNSAAGKERFADADISTRKMQPSASANQ